MNGHASSNFFSDLFLLQNFLSILRVMHFSVVITGMINWLRSSFVRNRRAVKINFAQQSDLQTAKAETENKSNVLAAHEWIFR